MRIGIDKHASNHLAQLVKRPRRAQELVLKHRPRQTDGLIRGGMIDDTTELSQIPRGCLGFAYVITGRRQRNRPICIRR
jgi:hypothetical protein